MVQKMQNKNDLQVSIDFFIRELSIQKPNFFEACKIKNSCERLEVVSTLLDNFSLNEQDAEFCTQYINNKFED
jgi:hypothetical protein